MKGVGNTKNPFQWACDLLQMETRSVHNGSHPSEAQGLHADQQLCTSSALWPDPSGRQTIIICSGQAAPALLFPKTHASFAATEFPLYPLFCVDTQTFFLLISRTAKSFPCYFWSPTHSSFCPRWAFAFIFLRKAGSRVTE